MQFKGHADLVGLWKLIEAAIKPLTAAHLCLKPSRDDPRHEQALQAILPELQGIAAQIEALGEKLHQEINDTRRNRGKGTYSLLRYSYTSAVDAARTLLRLALEAITNSHSWDTLRIRLYNPPSVNARAPLSQLSADVFHELGDVADSRRRENPLRSPPPNKGRLKKDEEEAEKLNRAMAAVIACKDTGNVSEVARQAGRSWQTLDRLAKKNPDTLGVALKLLKGNKGDRSQQVRTKNGSVQGFQKNGGGVEEVYEDRTEKMYDDHDGG
jgi:hypothetical protein